MEDNALCLIFFLALWLTSWHSFAALTPSPPPTDLQEAYFNGTSYVRLFTTVSLRSLVGISFRSCVGGEIFAQRNGGHNLQVSATSDGIVVTVTLGSVKREVRARGPALDNRWHFISLNYDASLPQITLTLDRKTTVVVANSSFQSEILSWEVGAVLVVGNAFSGCMLQGPQLVFDSATMHAHNVAFGPCPLTTDECIERRDILTEPPVDHCYHEPCMRHGVCISRPDRYECHCFTRYSGNNCQVDNGPPCASSPCRNGAICSETKQGDLLCNCPSGFHGAFCEHEEVVHPLCAALPCRHGGTCSVSPHADYATCSCPPGFAGSRCEVDVDECDIGANSKLLCLNGGRCIDGKNNYTCDCSRTGYMGPRCETNINECATGAAGPCGSRGVCFDTYGSFVCQCYEGYTGERCQMDFDLYPMYDAEQYLDEVHEHSLERREAQSSPTSKTSGCSCSNGGTCTEHGCVCPRGWTGPTCASAVPTCADLTCPPRSHCGESAGKVQCVCDFNYYGVQGLSPNCTHLNQMCQVSPCLNGGVCSISPKRDYFNCTCQPGFAGTYCELTPTGKAMQDDSGTKSSSVPILAASMASRICADKPCVHAKSCQDYSSGYYCDCDPNWAGTNCDITLVTNCSVQPCQNRGECSQSGSVVFCRCPSGFTGKLCERPLVAGQDACSSRPCLNGGVCRMRRSTGPQAVVATATPTPLGDFICECPAGFEGALCEKPTVSSVTTQGPCTGIKCGNGTCHEDGDSHKCTCDQGFTGMKCETDIDECKIQDICNQGICVNKPGGFECYCKPGYTGEHCDVDFDECLSRPCQNNGTCQNKINNYECVCVPGFTGKDCSININECSSSPCAAGSTCVDGVATFRCVCLEGLTGARCEINIDDCESAPCLHGGICQDELNGFNCDCTGTGYSGKTCAVNIDDCAPQPCRNGAACRDQVNGYDCLCYPGYTGKNCEQDVAECDSSPCQYNGICLERSNQSLYQSLLPDGTRPAPIQVGPEAGMVLPDIFYEPFSYENASGYECVCVFGVIGPRCQVNVNECESSPCGAWGTCVDRVGRYDCDCEPGFEGDHCQIDIDECDRYKPCKHGTCYDRRASYYCECEAGYGGHNCSVQLTGCEPKPEPKCLNGGDCRPWLQHETVHRFNCTCGPGYHGTTCEKITTMSLGGHSYIAVNTSRDEGYDIQFRFKTTLGNGLLAIGKGLTFYILELVNGRLNLHSSLLNKWEGVFIGSSLNDSNWQKVFVAINSSHLVLAANEEQTIYPINLNEGSNSSHTSFPTTYVGGTVSSLSRLTHGPPAFVGCVQDLTINGEWVLPDDHADNGTVELREVGVGCPRAPQCAPNPCHEAGFCEDLWSTFRCTCRRPHLGNTCQYNMTAATFGHESVPRSSGVAEVRVSETARRAIRSVLDISMFVRTRKPSGLIFYLGTKPKEGVVLFGPEETYVAASLVGGELLVRLQFNHTSEAYTVGGTRLDNGYDHLIQVVRNATLVQVKLNGTEYFRKPISAAGQLDAQVLYLGGPPSPSAAGTSVPPVSPLVANRQARSPAEAATLPTSVTPTTGQPDSAITQTPSQAAHITAADELGEENFFKGVIQDVQISNGSYNMAVEIFPLRASDAQAPPAFGPVSFDPGSILEGVVSDDACAPEPCNHDGVCQVTWNDYKCVCPRGFKGKSCDEMEFCQLQDCPLGSTCRNLDGGYECLANATFDGVNSTLMYRLDDEDLGEGVIPNFESLVITYRSKTGGTLMYVRSRLDSSWMSVSVYRDQLTVEWWMAETNTPHVKRFRKENPDYDWTTILIHVADGNIKGGFNDWMKEDSPSFSAEIDTAFWQSLILNGDMFLGGVRPPNSTLLKSLNNSIVPNPTVMGFGVKDIFVMDSISDVGFSNAIGKGSGAVVETATISSQFPTGAEYTVDGNLGENFKGCMGEVRIGDILLPYYTPEELYQDPSAYMTGKAGMALLNSRKGSPYVALGCVLCFEKDCHHGGHCQDIATNYKCSCPVGYEGDDCSIDIDECVDSHCTNGATCVDSVANYTCTCVPGWEGWLCDSVKDECKEAACQNSGVCTQLKPGEPLPRGQHNRWKCICPVEWAGLQCAEPAKRTCAHQPCGSGATCVSTTEQDPATGNKFSCICGAGYKGPLCDVPFCQIRPCQNGGTCSADSKQASCVCVAGWAGHMCELNIDECAVQQQTTQLPPCQHNGRCIDGVAEYICDCTGTGFSGARCETDIDECASQADLCGSGTCVNTDGSFLCECPPGLCGIPCTVPDPCVTEDPAQDPANVTETSPRHGPCLNEGICVPACTDVQDYVCRCPAKWTGKNCSQEASSVIGSNSGDDDSGSNAGTVALAIGVTLVVLAIAGGALAALAASARSKRATRGTYSPSSQEYCNPRLELDAHALKPPPEERLI